MVFRRIDDFLCSWGVERASTQRALEMLTDEALGQRMGAEGRTLGYLAWHLVLTLGEMPARTGLTVDAPAEGAPAPATAAEIAAAYARAAESFTNAVARWTDADLLVEDDMYGERWARSNTLQVLLMHQTHHRGQMTVLMRQAGLRVPSVCGPTREDWAAYGMPPQP